LARLDDARRVTFSAWLPAASVVLQKLRRLLPSVAGFVALASISLLFALPFLWMLSTSLKPDIQAVYKVPPQWIPVPAVWENYARAWEAADFSRYLLNSIFVASSTTLLQVVNASLVAYVFSRIPLPGRNLLFVLFLAVMMVPMHVTVVPVYILLSKLGWLNSYWALIVPFSATAFGAFLLRQSFLSVPQDLIDSAVMDGATHLQTMMHILIPLSKPAIITFALLTFTWRWNDYFWVLVMTTSDRLRTLPVGLVFLFNASEGSAQWHIMMAATVIVLIPILALFLLSQRYFVEGIMRTGLKG
jgi:ABC-type glycerol-3-phosphate transport system permease component